MDHPNVLKMPKKEPENMQFSNLSPEQISGAYIRAVLEIPGILTEIGESLAVIALYCEKKGMADGIITAEDLE